ncbi:hypothetical protein [Brevibacterium sp. FME37]|nr:hypothetical protein [Brevibacterium sp. FME37]
MKSTKPSAVPMLMPSLVLADIDSAREWFKQMIKSVNAAATT